MTKYNRATLSGLASIVAAAVIGTSAGLSSMVVSAADIAPADQVEPTVPNEPAYNPTIGSRRDGSSRMDRSGRTQVGRASFYADRYAGKRMADGTPMQLYSNNAASVTLPLGTTAKVTNLQTGKSAIVTIRDRGPYVKGRIVDLSPATARLIGLDKTQGLARVRVTPISLPLANGAARTQVNPS